MARIVRLGRDPFDLDETEMVALASDRIVRRGISYARSGRVLELAEGEGWIEARVKGSAPEPYVVTIEHDGEELLPSCTCPFDWEPFCKHAVAALALRSGMGDRAASAPSERAPALEEEEREVRRRRARKEGFRIRSIEGDGLFGLFEVRSPSGRVYKVEIRSLGQRLNRCSCPDFATSMLGTCKHVEAVLAAAKQRAPRKFERAAGAPPELAQVLVEQGESPRIRLLLPPRPSHRVADLASRYFDEAGLFLGDPVGDFESLRKEALGLRSLVIYGDAVELSKRAAAERAVARRRGEVERAVLAAGARIPGIRARLYPYQVQGAAFLASRGRALLGDDMGLGKTIQAIAAARILFDRGEANRALVVCPASLKHQWASELARFAGLEAVVVEGGAQSRLDAYRRQELVTIVNYEVLLHDGDRLGALAPDLLILDEAQRIKNWRAKTAEAVKSLETPFAFVLTGTPLQNRLDDLYSIMQVVDRRILGPLWAFNERFVERGGRRILGYKNLDELRRRLAPAVLRRDKKEVRLQLPELVRTRRTVELTKVQRTLMGEAASKAARIASIAERRPLTPDEEKRLFMAMQEARMACNAAALVDKKTPGAPKLDELEEVLRELCLEGGRKVVVFSEWERFCRLAAQRADKLGLDFVRLHGKVPTPKRGALIERFRQDPKCMVFFSTDAGGVGLNLQFASTLVNLELPWNPAVLEQRYGRVHRHGQTEPVLVMEIVSEASFEAGLDRVLDGKRALFAAALDADSEEDTVEAPSSCLAAVREALFELEGEDRVEPVFDEEQGTEVAPGAEAEPEVARDPARKVADLLGPRLRQVVALPSGRLLASVDRLDDAAREAGERAGVVVAEAAALEGLAALGEDSPLAGAEVILSLPSAEGHAEDSRRLEQAAVARRKAAAARKLAEAGLPAEAMGHAAEAMASALRALAGSNGADGEGLPTARLVFERLVPSGLLSLEQAAQVSRAEGLAEAYARSTAPVPAALLASVLADAGSLLLHAGIEP